MIVVKIGDGMGNQLFNYACGYAAARREHDTLLLDTSECDNSTLRDFMLDNFHLRYDGRESFPNRTVWQKLYKRIRRDLKYRLVKEGDYFSVNQKVFVKSRFRNKYLHGYWQNLAYFEEYLDEITAMMTPAGEQSDEVRRLQKEFRERDTCAIHVRGGDITGPGREFFTAAYQKMRGKKPGLSYIIFTNDMPKAKEALSDIMGEAKMVFIAERGTFSDVDEFFLMASCRNLIISNSTFSTWAAYLCDAPEKQVILPRYPGCEGIAKKDWIII